jgi:hypothetical protein
MLLKGKLYQLYLYHQCNQFIGILAGVTVMSLSASFQHKTTAATDHVQKSALNKKLVHKLKMWYKFSSHVKAKS